MSEATFQMELVVFLRAYARSDIVWWHVPNGEKRSRRTGAKLFKMGVRKGVADFTFVIKGQCHQLELKDDGGRMSNDQERFMEDVQRAGGTYHIASSMPEAIDILSGIGALRISVSQTAERSGCAGEGEGARPLSPDPIMSSPRATGVPT